MKKKTITILCLMLSGIRFNASGQGCPVTLPGPSNEVCQGNALSLVTAGKAVGQATWTSSAPDYASVNPEGLVSALKTGKSVFITYSDEAGTCKLRVPIVIDPQPGPITGTPNGVLCSGSTIPLIEAAWGGQWTTSDPEVATITRDGKLTGVKSGGVVVFYKATGACASSKSALVNAHLRVVDPPGPASGNVAPATIETDNKSNAWNTVRPVTGSYIMEIPGSNDLVKVNRNVCGAFYSKLPAQAANSVISPLNSIILLPNPSNGNFNLTGNAGFLTQATVADLQVIDMTGKEVYSGKIAVTNGEIHATISLDNNIADGIYEVKLTTPEGRIVQKLSLVR